MCNVNYAVPRVKGEGRKRGQKFGLKNTVYVV
jgi:hypothetical protein